MNRLRKPWLLGWACGLGLAAGAAAQSEIQFAVTNLNVYESNSIQLVITCQPAATARVNYQITGLNPPGGLNHLTNTPLTGAINFTNSPFAVLTINTRYLTNLEGSLPLLITLSNPNNAVLGAQSNLVLNILDLDTVFQFDTDIYRSNEDSNELVVTILRLGNTNGPASVDFMTIDGEANDTIDFLGHPAGITVFFADGQSSNTIIIPIIDDCLIETNYLGIGESFTNQLSNPVTAFGTATILQPEAHVIIRDNDSASGQLAWVDIPIYDPAFPDNPTVVGEPFYTNLSTFTIWVERPCGSGPIAVDYRVSGGSSCPGTTNAFHNIYDDNDPQNDFRLATPNAVTGPDSLVGTLTWGANDNDPKSAQIILINDEWVELDESMTITLFNARGTSGNPAPQIRADSRTLVVTIAFEDQPAGAVQNSYNNANIFVQDPGANNNVYAVALHEGGAIIGGDFTAVNTVPRNGIARINNPGTYIWGSGYTVGGALDTSFNVGEGAHGTVNALAVYPTNSVHAGKVLVGGTFDSFNGQPRNGIVRLNRNGSVDPTFRPGNGVQMADGVTPATVRAISILGDNKIVIAGEFDTFNSIPRRNIARLNEDGTLDGNFDPGLGADGPIWALALQPAPPFSVTQSGFGPATSRTNINAGSGVGTITLNYNAFIAPSTNAPTNGYSGLFRVYYAGNLIFDSGTNTTGTAAIGFGLGASTLVEVVVNEAADPSLTNWVWSYTATVVAGGSASKVLAGGDFTTFGGAYRAHIVRLNNNGTVDGTFDDTAGANGRVYAIAVQPDNSVVIGGAFSALGVASRNGVGRLTSDGALDETFNPGTGLLDVASGVQGVIYTMALDTNGAVYVAGEFSYYNGTGRTNIARLYQDGTLDTRFLDNYYNQTMPGVYQNSPFPGITIPGNIRSIAVENDGRILIGGRFDYVGGGGTADAVSIQHNYTMLIGGINPPDNNNPGNVQFAKSLYTVDENAASGLVNINLQRLAGVLGAMTSIVYTVDGSAIAGRDYTAVTQTVAWGTCSSGTTPFPPVQVPILNNSVRDGNRDFNLVIVTPVGIGIYATNNPALAFQSVAKVTIVDDDFENGVIGFKEPYFFVAEDATNAVLTLTRTNGVNGSVSVQYFTLNGTALSSPANVADYVQTNGTVTFAAGVTNQTIRVPIINDTRVEPEETVLLYLANPQGGATIGRATTTLIIRDNDNGRGSIGFTTWDFQVAEGVTNALINVYRSGGANNTQSVTLVVGEIPGLTNGAALAGADFVASTNILLFGVGETNKVLSVPIVPDTIVEGLERFQVTLYTNAGAYGQLGVLTNATVSVVDDDSYGVLSFLQPRFAVNEQETNAIITVVRRDGSSGRVTVNFTTEALATPDAAVETVNYLGASGVLQWEDGDMSLKTFVVPILYNPALEGNRVLGLVLSNPTKAGLGAVPNATLMIVDTESQNVPAGSVDTAFNASPGIDNFVQAIAVQNDGRLLVGGDFRSVNGVPRSRIARLHVNGELDYTFDPLRGFNDTVYALAVQGDGKVLAAGRFTVFDVTNRAGIARLNVDGKIDNYFNPGSGANNPIFALAVYRDGRIAVGGSFTEFGGIIRPSLVVLNTNGTVMTSFAPGTGPNGIVYALAYQPDGKLIVAGDFTKYKGASRNHIARVNPDGSLDPTFDAGFGPNASVRAVALQEDGKIVIGGLFTEVNGIPRGYVARLNDDGSLDTGFLDNLAGADGAVLALSVQTDGKVVAVGDFGRFNSVSRSRITRLNSDGSTDPTINFGTGANGHIAAVANQSDDQIVIGGGFTTFNGIERSYFARLIGYKNLGPGRLEFLAPVFYQNENITNAIITVRRNWGTSNEVRVTYATVAGGTAGPSDYAPVSGTLVFPQGETLQSFTVPIVNDVEVEEVETVTLALSDPTNVTLGGAAELDFQGTADLAIVSDDNVLGFSSPTYAVNENAVSGFAVITVLRTGSTNGFASVDIGLVGLTATGGQDYSNVVTTLSFAPGETSKPYLVPIIDDNRVEGDETAQLVLSNPSQGTVLGQSTATLTIRDDDTAAGILNFDSATYTVNEYETNLTIRVVRTGGSSGVVEVNYETADGTAQAGLDYLARSGSLAFVEGETAKTFNLPILQDFLDETNETVFLRLFNARGAQGVTIGNVGQATVVIRNSALYNGNLNFSTNLYTATETGGVAVITVNRLFGAAGAISVQYATTDGTAVAGVNYTPASGTLAWPAGDFSPKTFTVNLISNNLVEGNLTVGLRLSQPTGGASLGALDNATLTIVDSSVGPGVLRFSSAAYSVSDLGTNAVLTVLRTNGSLGAVSVDFATSDGTGVAGTHYAATAGTLSLTNGQTSAVILVPVYERPGADLNKTFSVRLHNAVAASLGAPSNAVVTILESATTAGSVNTAFSPDINGSVDVVFVQTNTDNKILIAGSFTLVEGQSRSNVARLNPNGTLDSVFDIGVGPSGPVRALVGLNDGRILVAGAFTNLGGVPYSYLARLLADGASDPTFTARPDNVVNAIAVQPDGKILIGGLFTSVGGVPRGYVARLQADGALDPTFLTREAGADGPVRAIVVQSDGRILIAGDFNAVNGLTRPKVARLNLDGSVDTSFNPQTGADGSIRALVLQPDNRVLIGGLFTSVEGVSRGRIARLNANGALDEGFNPGAGADEAVTSIALQQDGKILVGGGFASLNGYRRGRLARLNTDGSVDTTFNIGTGADNLVNAVVVQNDQKIVVGGSFTNFNGVARRYLVRLNGGFNLGPGAFGYAVAGFAVNESVSNAVITVVRSIGTAGEVRVDYSASSGSAVIGEDYQPVSGTLVFPDGETIQTFTVPIYDNLVPTHNRQINLTLSNPQGGAELGAPANATLTIVEDDGIIGFDLANFSVNEGAGLAFVEVTRTAGRIGPATVDYTVADGTALGGVDYTNVFGTLYFADGETSAFIAIPIVEDALIEGDETINLSLSNPTSATLGRSNATLTIVDNDFGPGVLGFSVSSFSVAENGQSVNITVRRLNGSFGNVSVNFAVTGGSAVAGQDFIATNGTLQFVDGETVKTFTVQVLDDGASEGNETILLTLSNPQGGATLDFVTATATLNILDDDVTPGAFRFLVSDFVTTEGLGYATVTVVRTNGSTGTVRVDFVANSGTAAAGLDFEGMTNTLVFTNGEVRQDIFITTYDDSVVEFPETINLRLSNPRDGSSLALPSTATLTILDNESFLSFGSAAYSVNEDAGSAFINVVRTGGTGSVVSVSYATSGGTAQGGSDYTPASGVLTFFPGETVKNFEVPITDNAITNANKTVGLTLFGPLGGALVGSPSNAVLTIVDNDSLVSFSATAYSVSESAGTALITVLRSGSIGVPGSVNFTASGGTAIPGTHYVATNFTLFFAANESQKTVALPVVPNGIKDGNRTVNLALAFPSRGTIIVQGSAVLTILDDDDSIIVPVAAALLAESQTPANSAIDPGETVTLNLALRNIGNLPATNLVATLLATNGVTAPSAAQTYGALAPNGVSVSRSFSFTAGATNGGVVTAVLKLQDGASDAGTVSFKFQVGRLTTTFVNTNAITIADASPASPYPSAITVAGLQGAVSKVTVTVSNITHGYPADVGLMLVGPKGQRVVLMSYAIGGWDYALANNTLTFDDAATNKLPFIGAVANGSYQPTNYSNIPFPAPAPSFPSPAVGLSAFNGTDPNGVWQLYVRDQDTPDVGVIAGGWSLSISTADEFRPAADVAVSATATPAALTAGNNLTYVISVANGGPSTATSVVATNVLPAGVTLVSATASTGTPVVAGGVVSLNLGSLASGSAATMTLVVNRATPGVLTNLVSVASAVTEPAADNNSFRLLTSVNPTVAPSFGQPTISGGGLRLNVTGQPGTVYYLEASTNLTQWLRVATNVLSGTSATLTDPTIGLTPTRFYRIVLP